MARRSDISIAVVVALALGLILIGLVIMRTKREDVQAPAASSAAREVSPTQQPRSQRPKADASISGTVRSTAGDPVAKARVCARPRAPEFTAREPGSLRCTASDSEGRYQLGQLWPVATEIHGRAPGFRPARADGRDGVIDLQPGETVTGVDLHLAPGGVAVRGQVRDITGGPIELAEIEVTSDGDALDFATSDAEGQFELWTAPGIVSLRARASGYARGETTAVAPGEYVELFLTPESVIVGQVVDAQSGDPLPQLLVAAGADHEPTAITDADGNFRLAELEPGSYKPQLVDATRVGWAAAQVHLGLGETSDPVLIRAHAASHLRAEVVIDPSGEPCPKGTVRLKTVEGPRQQQATIAAEGRVSFPGLLADRYHVFVDCPGYVSEALPELEVPAQLEAGVPLRWRVREGLAVRGEVVDASGEAVADVPITAMLLGEPPGSERPSRAAVPSDEAGRFALTGLIPGRYRVLVDLSHRGPKPAEAEIVELGASSDVEGVRIVLPAAGELIGRVVDTSGAPVSGVELRAEIASSMWAFARSNDAGEFSMNNLALGSARVTAVDSTGRPLPGPRGSDGQAGVTAEIDGESPAQVELVVEAGSGVIEGRVIASDGSPVSDAYVNAETQADGRGANLVTLRELARWASRSAPVLSESDGSFTLTGLGEGPFLVHAHRRGGGEAFVEDVAVGASVELVLAEAGSLAGELRLAGKATPERFEIRVTNEDGLRRQDSFFRTEGQWRLVELPPGVYKITAITTEATGDLKDVELTEGQAREGLVIELETRLTLRGRLVDGSTGDPVAGMEVTAGRYLAGGGYGFAPAQAGELRHVSDANGRFELDGVTNGATQLVIMPRSEDASARYSLVVIALDLPAEPLSQDIGEIEIVGQRLGKDDAPGDLGLTIAKNPPDTPPEERQLVVESVRPGGPAAAAGLDVGDRIIAVDGVDVRGRGFGNWAALRQAPVGTTVTLELANGSDVSVVAGPSLER